MLVRRLLAGKQGRKERGGTLWKLHGKEEKPGGGNSENCKRRDTPRTEGHTNPPHPRPSQKPPRRAAAHGHRQNPGGHPLKQEAKVPIASHGPDRHHTPPTWCTQEDTGSLPGVSSRNAQPGSNHHSTPDKHKSRDVQHTKKWLAFKIPIFGVQNTKNTLKKMLGSRKTKKYWESIPDSEKMKRHYN